MRQHLLFALIWLVLAHYRLRLCSPSSDARLIQRVGKLSSTGTFVPLTDERQVNRARVIGRILSKAADSAPWHCNCYVQALTVSWFLRRLAIPYALFLGVKRDLTADPLHAHAWVCCGPVYVAGGDGFAEFSVLGCYVWDPA